MFQFLNLLIINKIMKTEKKQWIAPQATEIEVNSGSNRDPFIENFLYHVS